MKASLKLELFGDDTRQQVRLWTNVTDMLMPGLGKATFGSYPPSSWCAEITGLDPKFKFKREFLRGKKDYSNANSKGSRGVFVFYLLESGKIYDVKSQYSWKNSDRYFCTVTSDGEIKQLEESEVITCLKCM